MNYEKDFKKAIENFKKVELTKLEKKNLMKQIQNGIGTYGFEANKTKVKGRRPQGRGWFNFGLSLKSVLAIFVAFILVGTTSLAYAAETSLPGSPLYAVKTEVVEKFIGAFVRDSKSAIAWYERLAERRLNEALALLEKDELDEEKSNEISNRIESYLAHSTEIQRSQNERATDSRSGAQMVSQEKNQKPSEEAELLRLSSDLNSKDEAESSLVISLETTEDDLAPEISGDGSAESEVEILSTMTLPEKDRFEASLRLKEKIKAFRKQLQERGDDSKNKALLNLINEVVRDRIGNNKLNDNTEIKIQFRNDGDIQVEVSILDDEETSGTEASESVVKKDTSTEESSNNEEGVNNNEESAENESKIEDQEGAESKVIDEVLQKVHENVPSLPL